MKTSRFEAFTDAIIAIVMTVLVLELKIPEKGTFEALFVVKHQFIIYLISFVLLAIYWNNHHQLVDTVEKINGRTLWVNNFFIFTLTLFPFATSWISDFPSALGTQAFYGVVILLADIGFYLLCDSLARCSEGKSLIRINHFKKKTAITILVSLVALLIGWLTIPMMIIIINTIAIIPWAIPFKLMKTDFEEE